MKRLLCLCLVLGVLPVATGCVEDAKAGDKGKAAETTKADPPPVGAADQTKNLLVTLPNLPATDPLVADTVQAREQIARLEEELLDRLDELRRILAAAKADPGRLRQSVEQFLELTNEVRRKTVQVGDALQAVEAKAADLTRSSRHLAASYRALAGLYRRKARDYAEPKLRAQLEVFADDYDAVAVALPERCRALDAARKKLPALQRKVAEVTAFLGDTASFLTTHPAVWADGRGRPAAELGSFAVTVSEWLRTLDDLRAALLAGAISKVIREAVQKEVAERERLDREKREAVARADRAKAEAVKRAELGRLSALAEAERARDRDRPPPTASPPKVVREPAGAAGTVAPPVPASPPPAVPAGAWPVVYRYQPVPVARRCP